MRHLVFQKFLVNGQELDRGLLRQGSYVETLDLSGPRLILELLDFDRTLQDDYGVVDDAVITVVIDDGEKRGGMSFSEQFVIKSATRGANEMMKVQALAKPVSDIKAPATTATFLTKKTVQQIMGATVGGGDIDSFPLVDAFHVSPGETISQKLRQLSRECAARVYYLRGTWYFKQISKLWDQGPSNTFYADDMRKDRIIGGHENLYKTTLLDVQIPRHYLGWEITKGVIAESLHGDKAAEHTQYHQITQLNNISAYIAPAIRFTTDGDGAIKPGQKQRFRFSRSAQGKPFDETVPEYLLSTEVTHWESEQKYQTLVQAGDFRP
ncbi:MAG: hypothetical protein OIF57_03300 [Marinobacterium sp.]|nr:hypothetical protein [Marinobacterium sp.]